jgi:V8-like Glu-specific endopeptidase
MTHRYLATCTLVLLGACSAESPVLLGERASAVVNGTGDSGHPSVGMLQVDGTGLCTATLVGKKTVLTAAHCVGTTHVFILEGSKYPVVKAVKHPNWDAYYLTNDIAVMLLASAPPAASSAIAITAPSLGLQITLVGYGVSSEKGTDAGTKRIATNKVSALKATTFGFTGAGGSMGSTCYGDSGGPAFATLNGVEVQVGVTSNGQSPCGTYATDTRVDAYVGWIAQTAAGDVNQGSTTPADTTPPSVSISSPAAGARVPLSITLAASIVDDVKVAKAEVLVDGQLAGSLQAAPWQFPLTLTEGAHSLQVNAYDAANNKGIASVTLTATTGDLEQPPPGDGPAARSFGAACGGPQDCDSGLCAADPATLGSYCTEACEPDGASCPLGAGCFPGASGEGSLCGAPMNSLPGGNGLSGDTLLGSCSLGGSPSPFTLLPVVIALFGIVAARRRRR